MKHWKRRGFLVGLVALLAVPVAAQGWLSGSDRKKPRRSYARPDVRFPEYRARGRYDYMKVNHTYWRRDLRSRLYVWEPCSSAEFYRARPLHPVDYPSSRFYRPHRFLPENYKSPVRLWWESYLKKQRKR